MKKVRVAVIGLGDWGLCHVEALKSIPLVEIVAICDQRQERLIEVGDRFEIKGQYTDSEQLLLRDDIDLVHVVTFEEDHLASTLQALQTGKHVLVEKPIATKLDEAKQMLEAARQYGRMVFPGHLLRFESRYAEIYQAIQSGQIGKPQSMYFKRARPKGAFEIYHRSHTVYLSTVHDLDLAIWYTGSRVVSVKAYSKSISGYESPDILWASLTFADGTLAFFHSNWMTPDAAGIELNDAVEVIGLQGIGQFENRAGGLELWGDAGRTTPALNIHTMLNGHAMGALREQLNYICQCISDGSDPNYISFEDAVHVIEVANAIVRSAAEGVEIELS